MTDKNGGTNIKCRSKSNAPRVVTVPDRVILGVMVIREGGLGMLALYFPTSVLRRYIHPTSFALLFRTNPSLTRWEDLDMLRVGPMDPGVRRLIPAGPQRVLPSAAQVTAAPSDIIYYP
jgi:hypothetical protein